MKRKEKKRKRKTKCQQSYNASECIEQWNDDESNFDLPYVHSANSRQTLYYETSIAEEKMDELFEFYKLKVVVDNESVDVNESISSDILCQVLSLLQQGGRFYLDPQNEGSVVSSLKVGIADEFDYSVDIIVDKKNIHLSYEPIMATYGDDDIDRYYLSEVQGSDFVDNGKRFFPYNRRPLMMTRSADEIQPGYIAVRLGPSKTRFFQDCCSQEGLLLPYEVLRSFHNSVNDVVSWIQLPYGVESVKLNNGARGPAISMTVQQYGGPNISIDVTPKLTLPKRILSLKNFKWPRKKTYFWLSDEKVRRVANQKIYLVPKGDKYWKISFANCENELLSDIDLNGTWRRGCLRLVKKKFMQWKSRSKTGLKGLSTYLLKTTLMWLCEILPEDDDWWKDQLPYRYFDFLQELDNRLRIGKIGEYFNPSVNLLENKYPWEIDELISIITLEMENSI